MNRQKVAKWCLEFNAGKTDVHDELRTGEAMFDKWWSHSKSWIKHLCWQAFDDQLTAWSDPWHVQMFGSWDCEREVRLLQAVFKVGTKNVDWKPQDKPNGSCTNVSHALLRRRWWVLESIVTGDETWLFHLTPENKQQSLEWRHTHSPTKKKFKTSSTKKTMATVFWWWKGVFLVDFMLQGTTINTAVYFETLKRLRCAIQNRIGGILTCSVCL
jgi:hypothetical protein